MEPYQKPDLFQTKLAGCHDEVDNSTKDTAGIDLK
jgi:hypothetical protein